MSDLDLADLIAPLSIADFVKRHWERRSLYAPGARDRFATLFDHARFVECAERATGPHGDDPRRLKAGFRDRRGEHAEMSIAAPQIDPLLDAGMTVQAEWLHESDASLAAAVASLRRSLAVPVELDVAAFLSPEGSGYGLHFDTTSMFVLQLEGTKRWHYGVEPAVVRPASNAIPDAAARAAGVHGYAERDLVVQELSPGDVLYLPAGAWHHVRATSRSLHLCVTLRPVNVLDLARDLLLDDLLSTVSGRSLPERPGALTKDPDGRARTEAWFAARLDALREAVARLTPAALADGWMAEREDDDDHDAPIDGDDVLVREVELRLRRAKGDGGERVLQVLSGDAVLAALPMEAETFLKHLVATKRFRAGDAGAWEPNFPWSDVAMLLREFVALGALRRT